MSPISGVEYPYRCFARAKSVGPPSRVSAGCCEFRLVNPPVRSNCADQRDSALQISCTQTANRMPLEAQT
jgi:hypothetical protein